jgi:hypothetical protein
MDETEEFDRRPLSPWIVSHRQFELGQNGLHAFSTEDRAHLYAARLIREELAVLLDLDEKVGGTIAQALQEGRYEEAVRLYDEVEGNPDTIVVRKLTVDEAHTDEALEIGLEQIQTV